MDYELSYRAQKITSLGPFRREINAFLCLPSCFFKIVDLMTYINSPVKNTNEILGGIVSRCFSFSGELLQWMIQAVLDIAHCPKSP